jgi:hypothetical protein
MAWYDEAWDDADDYLSETPDVKEIIFSNDPSIMDSHAQGLFVEAFFNDNNQAYIDLVDYMWDTYEIDFEDAFDWEDFREWYESQ